MMKLKLVVLKAFYSGREEEEFESNVELSLLLVLTTQANGKGGFCVGDSTAKSGLKPKKLTT